LRIILTLALAGLAAFFSSPAYEHAIQFVLKYFPVGEIAIRCILAGLFVFAGSKDIWNLTTARLGFDLDALWKKQPYKHHIAFLDEFQEEFGALVRIVCGGRPLVIVIDDLDRCLPQKAISVLEAIKQFLDIPGCVFLVALDQEILERAVSAKFTELIQESEGVPKNIAQRKFASAYIEKIVQLPISLPATSIERIDAFIKKLFPEDDTSAWDMIFASGVSRNPRKVKRALRVFQFLEVGAKAQIAPEKLKLSLLAKLVVLQHEARDVFSQIVMHPNLLVVMESVARGQKPTSSSELQALSAIAEDRLSVLPDIRRMLSLELLDGIPSGDDIESHLAIMSLAFEPQISAPKKTIDLYGDTWNR
jgi:KAP family P-loop domain